MSDKEFSQDTAQDWQAVKALVKHKERWLPANANAELMRSPVASKILNPQYTLLNAEEEPLKPYLSQVLFSAHKSFGIGVSFVNLNNQWAVVVSGKQLDSARRLLEMQGNIAPKELWNSKKSEDRSL